ncbi:MAG: hypothetical protein HYT39_03480, partial [Candidatus Sungbacteria bacterium]|nr:hypothetical protein [Candidatus Sungbacteria bacterium]
MNHSFLDQFKNQLILLPKEIQKKFNKQFNFLLNDLRHPSLRAKKYGGVGNVWQARVDNDYRFYFEIRGDTYF